MNVCAKPLGLFPVLLELGSVSLDLSLAGAGSFVCGQLLLVLLNLLLGCLQLLFVLLNVGLVVLNVLFQRALVSAGARRTWRCAWRRAGLRESCGAEEQARGQNQVKSIMHFCLAPPRLGYTLPGIEPEERTKLQCFAPLILLPLGLGG